MENPVPVQPSEVIIQPSTRKKYLGLSIVAGFLYGVPTLLIGFLISVYILISIPLIFDGLKIHYTVTLALAAFMGFVLAMVAGIISGRAVYRRSNENGTPRQAGYGMLSCVGIGLIGLIVFPVLCYSMYFLTLRLLDSFNLGNGQTFSFLTGGGGESAMSLIIGICIPSVVLVLVYIMAILAGGVAYRILIKKSI